MGIEIERKFLLKEEVFTPPEHGINCRQGYIHSDKERTVRVRTMNDQGFLTIKAADKGLARKEFEYTIPLEDANQMLDQVCKKPLIEKVRYKIPFEDFTWEVDVFFGENEGLIIAEIELEHEDQPFTKPPWIGLEVTDDIRYYNANLQNIPYSAW